MRWGPLLILQASHSDDGLAHRISEVDPEYKVFRVDVLTSLEGQRVFAPIIVKMSAAGH